MVGGRRERAGLVGSRESVVGGREKVVGGREGVFGVREATRRGVEPTERAELPTGLQPGAARGTGAQGPCFLSRGGAKQLPFI